MDRIKNVFDKIGSLIPGYKGYAEHEGRSVFFPFFSANQK